MLVQVAKLMYDEKPSTMAYLASRDEWVHETDSKERSKVAERCYIYSSCSTNTKRSGINFLFKEMGIPSSVLELELVPLVERVTDAENE